MLKKTKAGASSEGPGLQLRKGTRKMSSDSHTACEIGAQSDWGLPDF